jgi:hypothetical protein
MMRNITQPMPDPPAGTPAELAALLRSMTAKQPADRPAEMAGVAASAARIRAALAPVDPLGAAPFPAAPDEPDPDAVLERADTVRVTPSSEAWAPVPREGPTAWMHQSPGRPFGSGDPPAAAETRARPLAAPVRGVPHGLPTVPPRPSRRAPLLAALATVALLVIVSGAFIGYKVLNSATASGRATGGTSEIPSPSPTPSPTPTPSSTPTPTPTPSPAPQGAQLNAAGRALAARITSGHVDVSSCKPWNYAPGPGLQAAITCNSGDLSQRVGFLRFDSDANMTHFITTTKSTIAANKFGRCEAGLGQSNPWTNGGQTKGDLACVRTGSPLLTKVWWSTYGTGIVASAQDTDAAKAWSWFLDNSLIVE